ncbi:ABC transporter permease [Hyphobacterium indicum]|uniref:ABC transporter permease n=1 Tax=Hyphobacterium indicum TaxID=2162714 RepID=UPI000D64D346|nr:ABC transporter permease [Hyphobacterium indicum]
MSDSKSPISFGADEPEILVVLPKSANQSNLAVAFNDLFSSLANWKLWLRLSVIDIRNRYRRTVLGPFWNVLSMAILITTLGVLWSTIFQQDLRTHVPYFSAGYVTWILIVSVFNDHTQAFAANGAIIRAISLPFSIHIVRPISRNLMVFAHSLIVHIVVMIVTQTAILEYIPGTGELVPVQYSYDIVTLLLFPVGLLILSLNFIWIGLILATVCARYRDVSQVVVALLQVAFFATPIFWPRTVIQDNVVADTILAKFNPFFHWVEVVRSPLLGRVPSELTYAVTLGGMVLGFMVAIFIYSRYRKRISYWV